MSSRLLPQLESGVIRLGGAKVLFQRSGMVTQLITMLSAMSAAWSTTPVIREVFGSFVVFIGVAVSSLSVWMLFDYAVVLPSEQSFNQTQSQRAARSPLKRDTEAILDKLEDEK
ncbi:hypothetical protein DEQ92_10300 [Haloferax sp. Atlit-6N]|uniref:hypothetical protein n=1 Tax=Haloferax TaxID=2251 RepID=UPI0006791575|nr:MULTISPECIES: hypothetical protein [Haloferax]REA03480.1 hypothetical protein DEQ92_10125 [Haloferax sp. Atlit-6N]REA03508.1 hypothetical protein DEQ92_10300 [Haloferax sp. Atlit-6N]